jgi:hypothetical protein
MNRWAMMDKRAILSAVGESMLYQEQLTGVLPMDEHNDDFRKPGIPTLIAKKGDETRRFPLSHLTLRSGKTILPQHTDWTMRKIDLDGEDAGQPNLMTLKEYGMTFDYPCFRLTILGEAIGEPDYAFQFIGVESKRTDKIEIVTSEPFMIAVSDPDETIHVQIGYLWQSLVILKSESRNKSFCSETHNAKIISMPPHPRQQVVNIQIRPHLAREARPAEIRRVTRGYELMLDLWADIRKPIKYTEPDALAKSERIILNAKAYIAVMAWGKPDDLKIEPLAKKMRIGKQTIYDVDAACRFYGNRGLIERLKDIYKQERANKSKPS